MNKKIVLIDGHSILNRAFYGIPDLTTSQGIHTNAVLGFINILLKILEEEKPEYLTVAFDVKHPTFRHELYPEYKGTRKPMMEELRQQVPIIKEVLTAMNIKTIEQGGYEADDILGTIANRCETNGFIVSIVSGDRDLLQLASEKIKIRIPKTKLTGTQIEDYNEKDVIEKYMVTPKQFIDLKALMGDVSDNIPGVPGIGEKTATKIISQFKSIEDAYAHIEEVTPTKARESLRNNYHLATLSKTLATIEINCNIDYNIEEAKIKELFNQDVYMLFKKLEFKSLINKFNTDSFNANEQVINNVKTEEFKLIDSLEKAELIFESIIKSNKPIGFSIIAEASNILGISIAYSDNDIYFIKINNEIKSNYLINKINNLIENNILLSTINLKEELTFITANENSKVFDVEIGAYLLNPLKETYLYDDIAKDYLNITVPSRQDLLLKQTLLNSITENESNFLQYACYNAFVSFKAFDIINNKLKETNMLNLYLDIEMPLVYTLFEMEQRGIKADSNVLIEFSQKLTSKINNLEQEIYKLSGEEFNINSPKQLGEILFNKLKLPFAKKTKTGYSTSADILEKLVDEHEIINPVLEYRQLTKLKSTYADGLVNYINPTDSRIHGKFNQTITATGRISSTEPNLQNIPIRMELGREIRKAFVPEDGFIFVDADYSQIELRVLAHISGDELLINAYNEEQDIHKITASQVFNTPLNEVTKEQRSNAKAVNFGIVYGISSFGLGQDLNITRKEAEKYIEQYFLTYKRVKEFLDETVASTKETGYSVTMFNRRRLVPELKSSNFMQRSFGERIAMNSPIQGSAADIIKIAMIKVNRSLKERNLKSRLILQIHDELLIETHLDEIDVVKQILTEKMHEAADLKVPLDIDINTGVNWFECK